MAQPYFQGTRQYIGARYVPKFAEPFEWNPNMSYEPLTIVGYLKSSFTSKKQVPAGVAPTDTNYWARTGDYNGQIEEVIQDIAALTKRLDTAELDITDNTTRIDSAEDEITQNSGDIATAQAGVAGVRRDFAAADAALRSDLSALATTYNNALLTGNEYLVTVGYKGCNFTKVQEAIDELKRRKAAGTIPQLAYPTVLIFPGQYPEAVNLLSCDGMRIIGLGGPEATAIVSHEQYPWSAITCSGSGYVYGLTLTGINSYGMHYEFQMGEATGLFIFQNCRFWSQTHASAGCGLGPDANVFFYDCVFDGTGPDGGLYCHNHPTQAGAENLHCRNCTFINTSSQPKQTVWLDDATRHADPSVKSIMHATFDHCLVWARRFTYTNGQGQNLEHVPTGSNIVINMSSTGNNIPALNYDEQQMGLTITGTLFDFGGTHNMVVIGFPGNKARGWDWELLELYTEENEDIKTGATVEYLSGGLVVKVPGATRTGKAVRGTLVGRPANWT